MATINDATTQADSVVHPDAIANRRKNGSDCRSPDGRGYVPKAS